jgi:hypothetical protein
MLKESPIFCFIVCMILLHSLAIPTISNEKSQLYISSSIKIEHNPVISDPLHIQVPRMYGILGKVPTTTRVYSFEDKNNIKINENEFSNFISIHNMKHKEKSETKSSHIIMTGLYFTKKIFINENQIIEVWSQNISSESRVLYHKISGRYPDGSSFYGESDHIQIQPGKCLFTYFTVYNTGRGIGIFDFN